jgi:hypothetical protein
MTTPELRLYLSFLEVPYYNQGYFMSRLDNNSPYHNVWIPDPAARRHQISVIEQILTSRGEPLY